MTRNEKLAKAYNGLLGEEVVVKKGGRGTTVLRMATAKPKSVMSEKRIISNERLSRAAKYARIAMADPELSEMYTQRSPNGHSGYREAVNDFLRPPVIRDIDCSGYFGNPDDLILVSAYDKFALKEIKATLLAPDGSLIETGQCIEDLPTGKFIFTATKRVDETAGMIVHVTVRDTPGNTVEKKVTL